MTDAPDAPQAPVPPAFAALLERAGLSITEACARTGNPDLVRKLQKRKGRRVVLSDSLGRLARVLDVTLDDLARALELTDAPPARGVAAFAPRTLDPQERSAARD